MTRFAYTAIIGTYIAATRMSENIMLRKHELYENEVWPYSRVKFLNSPHHTIFLPGIMGSELYERNTNNTRWLDLGIWHEIDDLEYQSVTPSGAIDINNQQIYARSTVNPPLVTAPYINFINELKPAIFPYDWRESVPIEAKRLQLFLQTLPEDKPKNFVTHSMGGCILLYLLLSTAEFDQKIGEIIFCAPPFHGALKPIRVIEDGNGTPIDWIVRNNVLQQSAASMPGLFQLLVAPEGAWPTTITANGGNIDLKYPICDGYSLYNASVWNNRGRSDLLSNILSFAKRYHEKKVASIADVVKRLHDRITIIVGLNGKTTYRATRSFKDAWILHKVPRPIHDNLISNGDGTVLFQSSVLDGLHESRYWAEIPESQGNTHGSIMDRPNVISGVRAILEGRPPEDDTLRKRGDFINSIDWLPENPRTRFPRFSENLDYIERARMRSVTNSAAWDTNLNPSDDALTFSVSREAALRTMNGQDLAAEAKRIGQTADFLERHIQSLLMPILYP